MKKSMDLGNALVWTVITTDLWLKHYSLDVEAFSLVWLGSFVFGVALTHVTAYFWNVYINSQPA